MLVHKSIHDLTYFFFGEMLRHQISGIELVLDLNDGDDLVSDLSLDP